MLSVASLSSAGQAGSYYTKDNYYTAEEAREESRWEGQGAEVAGLAGKVEVGDFTKLLKGELPDGQLVGQGSGQDHRPGMDMTFSAPKSLSILAYIGGDTRLLDANMDAVRKTIAWAEKNLAQARVREKGQIRVENTGKLVVALFQHDTNRNLDPQAHVHAVIANVTQTGDGKWRALMNDQLWRQNALLGAIYHNYLREKVEALGYRTEAVGKHGTFEISGVSRDAIDAFSSRRQEILAKVAELGIASPEGRNAVTLGTRAAKQAVENRGALRAAWLERARDAGLDVSSLVEEARSRSEQNPKLIERLLQAARAAGEQVRALFGMAGAEPGRAAPYYVAGNPADGKEGQAAAVSVAAAVRHLSERETSFTRFEVARAALELGVPTTIDRVERQMARLEKRGLLIRGDADDRFTTIEGITIERRILELADAGRGRAEAIVPGAERAGERVQAQARGSMGFTLNAGQEGAARLLLASEDRIVNVQGVAGAGKSSVLKPVAEVAREEGRAVLALGVQNKLVAQLRADTGIEAVTVARFLGSHGRLLSERASPDQLALARSMFRGSVILVDEASMLSNDQAMRLAALANRLEVGRMAFVGDSRQLGAVEAGKPFEVMQSAGAPTAEMRENIRARDEGLRAAAARANQGDVRGAFAALRDRVTEAPGAMAERAVGDWLARPADEREQTLVMTSGRALMREVNLRTQEALETEGSLRGPGWETRIRDRVHATREEMRTPGFYAAGMVLEVGSGRGGRQPLAPGDYRVVGRDGQTGRILVRDAAGKVRELDVRALGRKPDDRMKISVERELRLLDGDKIRWTDNDRERGLFNADRARIVGIGKDSVTVETAQGVRIDMPKTDPMLRRLDLAYAMNTHQLQGATADKVIAVADSRETNLNTARLFLVNITRPRDELRIYVDNADRYERGIERRSGEKSSALETIGEILKPRSAIVAEPAKTPAPQVLEAAKVDAPVPVKQRQIELGL